MSLDASKLRRTLENERCSIHKQGARIEVKAGKLYISNYCCDDFQHKLQGIFYKIRDEQEKRDIDDKFNSIDKI
ncbi:MAG: hypothetical protein WKG06_35450 [Segetibacter sp.]